MLSKTEIREVLYVCSYDRDCKGCPLKNHPRNTCIPYLHDCILEQINAPEPLLSAGSGSAVLGTESSAPAGRNPASQGSDCCGRDEDAEKQ